MTKKERKALVRIGLQLGTLHEEDVVFMMDPDNTEEAVMRRLITARQRSSHMEQAGPRRKQTLARR